MTKRVYSLRMIFAVAVVFLLIFSPQIGKSEPPRTITLPSGEVVCDLRGEWNALYEHYGTCMRYGNIKKILEIKQEGDKFVAIHLSGGGLLRKGEESIRGELDQKGFRNIERYRPRTLWVRLKGEIINDCRKMVLEDEACVKITLERK